MRNCHCTHLGEQIWKYYTLKAHMNKVREKGKTQMARLDVVLRDSHPGSRMKISMLMKVIVRN